MPSARRSPLSTACATSIDPFSVVWFVSLLVSVSAWRLPCPGVALALRFATLEPEM